MKKIIFITITFLTTVIIAGNSLAQNSIGHSGKSLAHSGQSLKNSSFAAAHGSMASAKLTSGLLAIPFKIVGTVSSASGHVSNQIGDDLWNAGTGNSFELTDKNFIKVALPPHKAIQE